MVDVLSFPRRRIPHPFFPPLSLFRFNSLLVSRITCITPRRTAPFVVAAYLLRRRSLHSRSTRQCLNHPDVPSARHHHGPSYDSCVHPPIFCTTHCGPAVVPPGIHRHDGKPRGELQDEHGHLQARAVRGPDARDRQQLHCTGQGGLLRWADVSPRHTELRGCFPCSCTPNPPRPPPPRMHAYSLAPLAPPAETDGAVRLPQKQGNGPRTESQ